MTHATVDKTVVVTRRHELEDFIREQLGINGEIKLQDILRLLPKLIYEMEKFAAFTGPEKKQFIVNTLLRVLNSLASELIDQVSIVVPDAIDAIVLAFNSTFSTADKRKAFWSKLNCCS